MSLLIPEAEIKGVDISQYAKDHAIEPMKENIVVSNANNLPFPDDYFDGVFSNSVIHHIPEPIEVMLEVKRVLKPYGLIFFRDLKRLKSVASSAWK